MDFMFNVVNIPASSPIMDAAHAEQSTKGLYVIAECKLSMIYYDIYIAIYYLKLQAENNGHFSDSWYFVYTAILIYSFLQLFTLVLVAILLNIKIYGNPIDNYLFVGIFLIFNIINWAILSRGNKKIDLVKDAIQSDGNELKKPIRSFKILLGVILLLCILIVFL